MTGWIDRLRGLDWAQRLALIAMPCAYAAIAIPFFGLMPQRSEDAEILLLFLCSIVIALIGRSGVAAPRGASGLSHVGGLAMVMMSLWTLPSWPFPRPQRPDDFMIFLWSFIVLASATRVLSARRPERGDVAKDMRRRLA